MPEHDCAVSIHDVDILIAVDVPDPWSLRSLRYKRIDHLFPLRAESGDGTRVGKMGSRLCCQSLRFRRPSLVFRNKRIEILLLTNIKILLDPRLERPVGTMFDVG